MCFSQGVSVTGGDHMVLTCLISSWHCTGVELQYCSTEAMIHDSSHMIHIERSRLMDLITDVLLTGCVCHWG